MARMMARSQALAQRQQIAASGDHREEDEAGGARTPPPGTAGRGRAEPRERPGSSSSPRRTMSRPGASRKCSPG